MAIDIRTPTPITEQFRESGKASARAGLETFAASKNIAGKAAVGVASAAGTAVATVVAVPASAIGAVVDAVQVARRDGIVPGLKDAGLRLGGGVVLGALTFGATQMFDVQGASVLPISVAYVGALAAVGAPIFKRVGASFVNLVQGAATSIFGWTAKTLLSKPAEAPAEPPKKRRKLDDGAAPAERREPTLKPEPRVRRGKAADVAAEPAPARSSKAKFEPFISESVVPEGGSGKRKATGQPKVIVAETGPDGSAILRADPEQALDPSRARPRSGKASRDPASTPATPAKGGAFARTTRVSE